MRKSWGAAVAAAVLITGGGLANAMDYRIGFQARTDGGWSPFAFRYSGQTDEQKDEAHVLEINGKPAEFTYGNGVSTPIGDQQPVDYEDGFALWSGGIKGFRFQPMFQATSNSGAFAFGARFMVKNKEHEEFNGVGWSSWLDYKNFEVKVATTGSMGYGAYVGTGGNFYLATTELFAWELTSSSDAYLPKYFKKGNSDDFNYFGYQTSNAGLGVENISDTSTGIAVQWTQKIRSTDTLNLRLVNLSLPVSGGNGYKPGREYDTTYPVGWNVQANYRMPTWTFSTTFKIRGGNGSDEDKYGKPDFFDISWHGAFSTTRIPNTTLSAGYSFIAENVGNSPEADVTINDVTESYSRELWGHNFGLSAAYRWQGWTFNFDNTTTLMLLSDYMKARSNKNRYGWRPYIGETVTVSAHKRINGLMTGHLAFNFSDANMNSYTDGKAEATFSFTPSVDIAPARGVNVNVALSCSLQNFSDQARGWWSDYNSDADFGNSGEIYYTYPHTLNISIPISLSISI